MMAMPCKFGWAIHDITSFLVMSVSSIEILAEPLLMLAEPLMMLAGALMMLAGALAALAEPVMMLAEPLVMLAGRLMTLAGPCGLWLSQMLIITVVSHVTMM